MYTLPNFELSEKSKEIIRSTLNVEDLDDTIDIDYKEDSDGWKESSAPECVFQVLRTDC